MESDHMEIVKDESVHDIELYLSDVDLITNEYINSLGDTSLIYKVNCFNGLLLTIYNKLLKNVIPNTYRNDYELLNSIFHKVYLPLCFRFNINPTVLQFCSILVKIDNTNISDIKKGTFRNGYRVNDGKATQMVKEWYSICESGLLSRAICDNSIGAIFSLKSLYQYKEADAVTVQESPKEDYSISRIASKYDTVSMPTLPNIDDD